MHLEMCESIVPYRTSKIDPQKVYKGILPCGKPTEARDHAAIQKPDKGGTKDPLQDDPELEIQSYLMREQTSEPDTTIATCKGGR